MTPGGIPTFELAGRSLSMLMILTASSNRAPRLTISLLCRPVDDSTSVPSKDSCDTITTEDSRTITALLRCTGISHDVVAYLTWFALWIALGLVALQVMSDETCDAGSFELAGQLAEEDWMPRIRMFGKQIVRLLVGKQVQT